MNNDPFDRATQWRTYPIEFKSRDGVFVVHLHAVSEAHAQEQLIALKTTGRVLLPQVPMQAAACVNE